MTGLRVHNRLEIPDEELEWSFTPSPGPGGQHANKTSTRAEVMWNIDGSGVLSESQRQRIRKRLGRRIDASGTLRVGSSTHRSQLRNREEARRRLAELVRTALQPDKPRRPTRPTVASREDRLRAKKQRSETKRLRRAPRER